MPVPTTNCRNFSLPACRPWDTLRFRSCLCRLPPRCAIVPAATCPVALATPCAASMAGFAFYACGFLLPPRDTACGSFPPATAAALVCCTFCCTHCMVSSLCLSLLSICHSSFVIFSAHLMAYMLSSFDSSNLLLTALSFIQNKKNAFLYHSRQWRLLLPMLTCSHLSLFTSLLSFWLGSVVVTLLHAGVSYLALYFVHSYLNFTLLFKIFPFTFWDLLFLLNTALHAHTLVVPCALPACLTFAACSASFLPLHTFSRFVILVFLVFCRTRGYLLPLPVPACKFVAILPGDACCLLPLIPHCRFACLELLLDTTPTIHLTYYVLLPPCLP